MSGGRAVRDPDEIWFPATRPTLGSGWGVVLAAGRSVGLPGFGRRLFDLLDDVGFGFLAERLHQVFLGVFVGGGVEGDFLCSCGVPSSDDDVGDSFQFGERLTDVLFTAASRNACHSDRINGLGGSFSRADPCEEGQSGECRNECFHVSICRIAVGLTAAISRGIIRVSGLKAIRESSYPVTGKKAGAPGGGVAGWGVMSMGSGRWIPAVVAVAVLLAVAGGAWVLRSFDPALGSLLPPCRFYQTTGLHCPGCGMTRATHHLLNGRVGTAFYFNAFYVAVLPGMVLWGGWWVRRWWDSGPLPPRVLKANAWCGGGLIVAWLAFWLVRNLPGWPLM